MDAAELEALTTARRYLAWASFLLAAMLAILVIDLQLKKAVARQATQASAMLSEVRHGGQGGERVESPADNSDQRGGGDDDRVGGPPPGSAGLDGAEGQGAAAPGTAPVRGAGRKSGDDQ